MSFLRDSEIPKIDYDAIMAASEMDAKPPEYEDTQLKEAVDDLDRRISQRLNASEAAQRRTNTAMLVIGALTLIATIAGVVLQLVK